MRFQPYCCFSGLAFALGCCCCATLHPRLIARLLWPIRRSQRGCYWCRRRGLKVFINYVGRGRPGMACAVLQRLLGSILFPCVWLRVPGRPGNEVNKAWFGISKRGPKVTAFLWAAAAAEADSLCNAGRHLQRPCLCLKLVPFPLFSPPVFPHLALVQPVWGNGLTGLEYDQLQAPPT